MMDAKKTFSKIGTYLLIAVIAIIVVGTLIFLLSPGVSAM